MAAKPNQKVTYLGAKVSFFLKMDDSTSKSQIFLVKPGKVSFMG
jgi:hypothetical protein